MAAKTSRAQAGQLSKKNNADRCRWGFGKGQCICDMEAEITEISLEPCVSSKYVLPYRVNFKQVRILWLVMKVVKLPPAAISPPHAHCPVTSYRLAIGFHITGFCSVFSRQAALINLHYIIQCCIERHLFRVALEYVLSKGS
jgi:hypothetical protein